MICRATLTLSDSHFQVNQLSQHLLAMILLPTLKETPNSRIVCQSSDLHQGVPSDVAFASKQEINTDIGPTYLYGRSKLAQILWVRLLHEKLTAGVPAGETVHRIFVNATHPGAVLTDQPKQAVCSGHVSDGILLTFCASGGRIWHTRQSRRRAHQAIDEGSN